MSRIEIINNPTAFFADRNKLATECKFMLDGTGKRERNKP